jgi:hypothetical protein
MEEFYYTYVLQVKKIWVKSGLLFQKWKRIALNSSLNWMAMLKRKPNIVTIIL